MPWIAVEASLDAAEERAPSSPRDGPPLEGVTVLLVEDERNTLEAMQLTLEGRVASIRCPTLLTMAEDDPLSHGAEALLAELACDKTLLRFTAAEGAGRHCEMSNRSLANLRMLDWLEAKLGP